MKLKNQVIRRTYLINTIIQAVLWITSKQAGNVSLFMIADNSRKAFISFFYEPENTERNYKSEYDLTLIYYLKHF